MLENIQTIVAIVGCQRSGTTLTGQILGAHPNALLVDETDGLYPWFESYQHGDDASLEHTLLTKADKKYADGFKRTCQHSGHGKTVLMPSVTHLILKAPNLTYSFESLSKLDIPVKVVYPVRDSRAVVASMENLSDIPFVENQIRWIGKNEAVRQRFEEEINELNSQHLSDHIKKAIVWNIKSGMTADFVGSGLAVHKFLYENLVKNSDEIVKQLCHFLELEICNSMLTHQSVYVGYGPGGTARFRPIDNHSVFNWKNQISSEKIAEISNITGSLMNSLGYDKVYDAK